MLVIKYRDSDDFVFWQFQKVPHSEIIEDKDYPPSWSLVTAHSLFITTTKQALSDP